MANAVTVTKDGTAALAESLAKLTGKKVYVGIPQEKDARTTKDGHREEFGNAAIGYVQENGSPATNLPARAHLVPGVRAASPRVAGIFGAAARDAIDGKGDVDASLTAAGLIAVSAVKNIISQGIPPPLADSTLRSRKGQAAKDERSARFDGFAPSTNFAKPLERTGEYMAHITSVIRKSDD